jgi:hypothetical protein
MTDKLFDAVDDALVAFGNYASAVQDPDWMCAHRTFARLEEEMRKLDDVFHETRPLTND